MVNNDMPFCACLGTAARRSLGSIVATPLLSTAAFAGASTCCTGSGPGCDDPRCEAAVCAVDPFCCDTAWDSICIGEAERLCGELCRTQAPPLCCNLRCAADLNADGVVEGGDLGVLLADWNLANTCSNLDGDGTVDGADLGMLLAAWGACRGASFVGEGEPCGDDVNGGCNTPPSGDSDCCVANGGLGCDDPDCQQTVCAIDPFCCDVAWDVFCAGEAIALCGDLCGVDPQFGAIDCGDQIIGVAWADGGARDTDWYQVTFDKATTITLSCQSQLPMVFGVVDTRGVPECELALALNPSEETSFCGGASIEGYCLGAGTWWIFAAPSAFGGFPCGADNAYWLELECGGVCEIVDCGNAGHDCFTEGGPFCDDRDCCRVVCSIDPFCCEVKWDSICVEEAAAICGGG